jgi:hypothetical protein
MTDDESTYDSMLDSLKLTEPEYRGFVIDAVSRIQQRDDIALREASRDDLIEAGHEMADEIELFDDPDGATLGAILQFAKAGNVETREETLVDPMQYLERLARDAFAIDVSREAWEVARTEVQP